MNTVEQARADLDYIRQTLEQAGTFTTISGGGLAGAGAIGIAAAAVSAYWLRSSLSSPWRAQTFYPFLLIWIAAAALAIATAGLGSVRKARRWNLPLYRGPARRALRCMAPGWVAAVLVTAALVRRGAFEFVPAAWLLLDGLALLGAATFSIPPVRWMGWILFSLGTLAALVPDPWISVFALAGGFGLLHLAAGIYIGRSDRE